MSQPPIDDSVGESFDLPNQSAAPSAEKYNGGDPYYYARAQLAKGVEPREIGKSLRAAGYSPQAVAEILIETLKPQQGGQAQAGVASGPSRGAVLFALIIFMASILLKCLGANGPTGTVIFLLLDFIGLTIIVWTLMRPKKIARESNEHHASDQPSKQN